MTEESRREWLSVAWITLKHLPADLLRIGCSEARKNCDHPSKIVPTIVAETEDMLRRRRANAAPWEPPALPSPDRGQYCTPEQAAEILREFGLKRNPLDVTREAP